MFSVLILLGIGVLGSVALGFSEDNDGFAGSDTVSKEGDGNASDLTEETPVPFFEFEEEKSALISGIPFDSHYLSQANVLLGTEGSDHLDGSDGEMHRSPNHLFGGAGSDILIGGDNDVLLGGEGLDQFEINFVSEVIILDFQDDEVLVVHYEGDIPKITGDDTDDGTSILANGFPIVHLENVYDFDLERISLKRSI